MFDANFARVRKPGGKPDLAKLKVKANFVMQLNTETIIVVDDHHALFWHS